MANLQAETAAPAKRKPTKSSPRRESAFGLVPSHVVHPTFKRATAEKIYDAQTLLGSPLDSAAPYMPDDDTREHARRMHYAAFRMGEATNSRQYKLWQARYHALRDRIVLGNRKLIYRAVKRTVNSNQQADDLIGDCHIVLIQAVAVYNPWIGIRFSTYAFTCLVRALVRQMRKSATDRLSRALSFDALPESEPFGRFQPEQSLRHEMPIADFLKPEHPLLDDREKAILARRYSFTPIRGVPTLETVGRSLGLSKERVRQVQTIALEKIRLAVTQTAE
jgi:RNA polymerase sigma factor (sigma-70 family)